MDHRLCLRIGLGLMPLLAAPAAAQPVDGAAQTETAPAVESEPDPAAMAARLDDLETRLRTAEQSRRARFPIKLTGHGDLGFFATEGDGAGFRRDAGHVMFPDRAEYAWVFYGDLLATMVNSRGDAADLGEAPGVDRVDAINSEGNPSFLVNELSVGIQAGLGSRALFSSSVNFT